MGLVCVFGEWCLQQNDLNFLNNAVYKGETFRDCAAQWSKYKNVYVQDSNRPAGGKGTYTVLVNLRNHPYWSCNSYLNLDFKDDRLTGTYYNVFHESLLPWVNED